MKPSVINNNGTDNHLKNGYLELAYQAVQRFEDKIRKSGYKSFNVWKFLEDEYYKELGKTYRKPPKASTIRQWFDEDPVTRAKMGTDDLLFICSKIDDPTPLIAFYEHAMESFEYKEKIVVETASLTRKLNYLSIILGRLYEKYDQAIADGKVDKREADTILAVAENLMEHLLTIIQSLTLEKLRVI
jgi:hypothetical protein